MNLRLSLILYASFLKLNLKSVLIDFFSKTASKLTVYSHSSSDNSV